MLRVQYLWLCVLYLNNLYRGELSPELFTGLVLCSGSTNSPPDQPKGLVRWSHNALKSFNQCMSFYCRVRAGTLVVSTAAFHARVRGSLLGLKEKNMCLPHSLVKLSIVWSLRDRGVACSASDLQALNCELCVWRAGPSHSSQHHQEVLLAQFNLYMHKSGLKPDSFHFISCRSIATLYTESNVKQYSPTPQMRWHHQ